jgi:cytochrome c peroxidase
VKSLRAYFLLLGVGILCWGARPLQLALEKWPFPEMRYFPRMPLNPDNPITVEGASLGRFLFYDPILSADSTISCASCHQQQYAFSNGPVKLSRGIAGKMGKRNTPALYNLAWYEAMFWDGRAANIEAQVFHPVRDLDEMGMQWKDAEERIRQSAFYKPKFRAAFGDAPIDSQHVSLAIGQFLRTLVSYQTKYDRALRHEVQLSPQEYRGFVAMSEQNRGNCLHCHPSDSDPMLTNRRFANNGLENAQTPAAYPDPGLGGITGNPKDYGKFKVPSLRNIAVTAPYMHDGRFGTLEEVLEFYSTGIQAGINTDSRMAFVHQGGTHMTCDDKEDIVAFLRCLTDTIFLSDPRFSNPF